MKSALLVAAVLVAQVAGDCSASNAMGGTFPAVASGSSSMLMCSAGSIFAGTATCSASSFGTPSYACTPIVGDCPAATAGNAAYPMTPAGVPGLGQCLSGYSGAPVRHCLSTGEWDTEVAPGTACVQNQCPATTGGGVSWPATLAPNTVTLACPSGMIGAPTRQCKANGQWGFIENPCVTALNCAPSYDYAHIDWPSASAGALALGKCNPGYVGSPFRQCQANGQWASTVSSFCTRTSCPEYNDGFAMFNQTLSGQFMVGKCNTGYVGGPSRFCNFDAMWEDSVGNLCVPE